MSLKVELLEQSFELVKPKANEFVASFYNNLFTDYPASQPLFAHSDMAAQQKMLKGALVMVIENLRQPDILSKSLKGLGARHVQYGALPEHYPLVGNSLLKTLGQYAGDAWTPELKDAWVGAYGAITELMLEGADYAQSDVQLSAPSAQPVVASTVPSPAVATVPGTATTSEAVTSAPTMMRSAPASAPAVVRPAGDFGTGEALPLEAPEGISNGLAAGIVGGCGAALAVLLLILL